MSGFDKSMGVTKKIYNKDGLRNVNHKIFRGVQQAFPTIVGLKGRQELFRLSGLPEGALAEVQKRL